VLVVALVSFRVWSGTACQVISAGQIAVVAAVMTAVLVAIVLFGIWRVVVVGRALVFVIRAISSFVDTVG
jgi:hypothetical protein